MKKIFFLVTFIMFPGFTTGQNYCNKLIKPIDDPQLKYKPRGNNICEGFYVKKSSGGFQLVGLMRGNLDFALHPEEKVEINYPNIEGDTLFIRAQPVPLKIYYLMNGICLPGKSLIWSMDEVISRTKDVSLEPQHLGITGHFKLDSDKDIYIPISSRSTLKETNISTDIQILFRSTIDVDSVHYAVVGENFKKDWTSLDISSFIAGTPITFKLPFSAPGLYRLKLTGKNKYGKKDEWPNIQVTILIPE